MLQDLPFYLLLLLEVDLQERLWGGFVFFPTHLYSVQGWN